jgi:hypothetical protein
MGESAERDRGKVRLLPFAIVLSLSSMVRAGCGGDSGHPDIIAFNRQARTVEKTYPLPLSRLVECMIEDDRHEPHPQFEITADRASFDLPGVFRTQLTASGTAETRAVVTALPGSSDDNDGNNGLDHYVGVLNRCAGRG